MLYVNIIESIPDLCNLVESYDKLIGVVQIPDSFKLFNL